MPLADRALVVGITRYPGIGNLDGPENDANDFFDWVTRTDGGGVDPKNALRIRSSDFLPPPPDARNERPAQEQINDFFTDVDDIATANNNEGNGLGLRTGRRLWMFFSGHGFAPSLELSGVLMANATLKRVFNISAVLWANRLHEGGWFDDVLLFQDACRNRISAVDLNPPFLKGKIASSGQTLRRFYAFSSKDQKLSKEVTFPDGKVRGVFAATLLDGLRGAARDRATGAVTTQSLKTYLQDNMKKRLSPADMDNPEIAKEPDVRDPDLFDIVPAAAAIAGAGAAPTAIAEYPVQITLPAAGLSVTVQDGNFQPIRTADPADQVWSIELRKGVYRIVVAGGGESLFKVDGPGGGPGGAIDVHV
jgi:uncharacterized caspase-like protein